MSKIRLATLVLTLLTIPFFGHAQTGGASLTLSPSTASLPIGSTFTVNIVVNTAGQKIYGVDVNKLHFNPSVLQVVDTDSSVFGVQITPGTILPLNIVNEVDNAQGTVKLSALANFGNTYTGSGIMATITFKVVALGTSPVGFDFVPGVPNDTNMAGASSDILTTAVGGTYIGTVPVGNVPPPQPSNPPTPTPTTPAGPQGDTIPPTISMTVPIDGTTVSGQINLAATASDNTSVAGVQFVVDGLNFGTEDVTYPFGVSMNTTVLTNGTHNFYAIARDPSGNIGVSNKINVTVSNDVAVQPPLISLITARPTSNSATITFHTNQTTVDTIDYGPTMNYGGSIPFNTTYSLDHSRTIPNLISGIIYHYRIRVKNSAGVIIETSDGSFVTPYPIQTTPSASPAVGQSPTTAPKPPVTAPAVPPKTVATAPASQRQVFTTTGSATYVVTSTSGGGGISSTSVKTTIAGGYVDRNTHEIIVGTSTDTTTIDGTGTTTALIPLEERKDILSRIIQFVLRSVGIVRGLFSGLF